MGGVSAEKAVEDCVHIRVAEGEELRPRRFCYNGYLGAGQNAELARFLEEAGPALRERHVLRAWVRYSLDFDLFPALGCLLGFLLGIHGYKQVDEDGDQKGKGRVFVFLKYLKLGHVIFQGFFLGVFLVISVLTVEKSLNGDNNATSILHKNQ